MAKFTNIPKISAKKKKKNEAAAMEAETLLSVRNFLMENLKATPLNLSNDLFDKEGRQVQEWDGILWSQDAIYLLEAKHSMTVSKEKAIGRKVKKFSKIIERSSSSAQLIINYL